MTVQIIDFAEARARLRPYRSYTSANLRQLQQIARAHGDAALAAEITKELFYREKRRAS